MAKRLRFIRHSASVADAFVGREGELTVDLDADEVRVHDGVKAGGHGLARKDLANVLAATASRDGKMTQAQVLSLANVVAGLAQEIIDRIADVDAEESARMAADTAEATARANADNLLDVDITANALAISNEVTARTNADSALAIDISNEATARASADTTLTTNLNNFIAQKAAANGLASLNALGQVLQQVLTAVSADSATTATTATRLATARTIALIGDGTGSADFDGSGNINITLSLAANSVADEEIAPNSLSFAKFQGPTAGTLVLLNGLHAVHRYTNFAGTFTGLGSRNCLIAGTVTVDGSVSMSGYAMYANVTASGTWRIQKNGVTVASGAYSFSEYGEEQSVNASLSFSANLAVGVGDTFRLQLVITAASDIDNISLIGAIRSGTATPAFFGE